MRDVLPLGRCRSAVPQKHVGHCSCSDDLSDGGDGGGSGDGESAGGGTFDLELLDLLDDADEQTSAPSSDCMVYFDSLDGVVTLRHSALCDDRCDRLADARFVGTRRTVSLSELKVLTVAGEISDDTEIWMDGMQDWATIAGLMDGAGAFAYLAGEGVEDLEN
eukprot:SAG25_NODE_2038_length_2006_cov_1.201363_2_plen_163_part_00